MDKNKKHMIKGYAKHLFCSLFICGIAMSAPKIVAAVALALCVGLWKEYADYYSPTGTFDIWDIVADVAGILIFVILYTVNL